MTRWFRLTLPVTIFVALPLLADPPSRPLTVAELDRLGPEVWRPVRAELRPARWIWLPSQRTLPQHLRALPAGVPSRPGAPSG